MSGEMATRIWRNKSSWIGFKNIIRNPIILNGSVKEVILKNQIKLDKEIEREKNKLKKINEE